MPIWAYALSQFDHRVPFKSLARVWFFSSLARYIPGKVWQFVGIAELGRSLGIPAVVSVTSVLVFMGHVLLAAWYVGIYLLPPDALGPLSELVTPLRLASPLLLLLLFPGALRRGIALIARLTRRECAPWQGGVVASLVLLSSCALLWLGFGVAFFVFVGSLTPVSASQYPALTAIFALAFLASYLIVIAPAGLGAKEGVMALLLASTLPLSVAAAVAVASRLWSTLAEMLPALVLAAGTRGEVASS